MCTTSSYKFQEPLCFGLLFYFLYNIYTAKLSFIPSWLKKKKEKEKEKRRSSFESEGALEVLCGLRVIEPVYNGNVNISDVLKL